jgi:hypothetical protein
MEVYIPFDKKTSIMFKLKNLMNNCRISLFEMRASKRA